MLALLTDAHISPSVTEQVRAKRVEIVIHSLQEWRGGAFLQAGDDIHMPLLLLPTKRSHLATTPFMICCEALPVKQNSAYNRAVIFVRLCYSED